MATEIISVFFLLSFLSSFFCYADGEERIRIWKLIGRSKTETRLYMDIESEQSGLSPTSNGIVSAWIKSIPEKVSPDVLEFGESTEETLKKIQARNFGDYEYTEALWESDCSKVTYRILSFSAYNKAGDTIASLRSPDAQWSLIIPGSAGEIIHEAVCGMNRATEQ